MRNRLFLILFAFAFFAIGASTASAQGVLTPQVQVGFLAGPVGGINLVAYNSDQFNILASEPNCFLAQNGSDIAAWGGLSLEFPLGNAEALQNFIVGEVLYDSKSSKFTNVNGAQAATPTKENGVVYNNSGVTTALTANLSYLEVNLAYKYNFTPGPSPVGPGIMIGPAVGIKMSSNLNKTVTVTATNGNPSNPGSVTQTVSASNTIASAQALRISLRAAATYDISFSNDWIATPVIGYDFPLTQAGSGGVGSGEPVNWRASSLFGGIAIRYFIRG